MNRPDETPHPEYDGDEDDDTLLFRPPFIDEDDALLADEPLLEADVESDVFIADELVLAEELVAETAAVVPVVVEEAVAPVVEPWSPPAPPPEPVISFWTLILRPKQAAALRIDGLGRAIDRSPNVPSNYVLRGELYLQLKRYADAEMDFRRALDLAAAQVESQDWGVVAQVLQDRALAGLKQTRSKR